MARGEEVTFDVGSLPEPGQLAPEQGWIDPSLRSDFPALRIFQTTIETGSGRSPRSVRAQLRALSDRFYGSHAINLRQQPIPSAYRVFFRQIGLDPDTHPTPVEEIVMERLRRGRFKSISRLDDAITVGTMETGVALRAFDADAINGRLGLRLASSGERLEGQSTDLPAGTIVIADEQLPVGILFGQTAARRGVGSETTRIILSALQVKGVPQIAVEEALWAGASVLSMR